MYDEGTPAEREGEEGAEDEDKYVFLFCDVAWVSMARMEE
eukprot:CAMPEP_0175042442 /NCGR_PEP_ID=MMETSP0052_2-20121109/2572_1 /TAXON_ID=51329 ORGANISM="Polytomella parva, Strain SAG 63-3" /NCGR_SAMPLE_ID=MMETSP0052_2 /ASSEMBLY_ACC=CAM_ASM_000194 /LENGTH=39 /DNA_ID= /DNA_START= /DNA_END= /DNA_ORIENTATION=